jgi:UDP-hydrolysing UDP-N-acetyl-D-glucosamine 2-epimerase
MKKILAITTIRSDYDLMSYLYKLLHNDRDIDLKLVVGGAHLSYGYGHSVDLIENDGFNILLKVESLIDSNSKQSRLKSASILLQNSIDAVANFAPDLIIYAGDREDTMVGALLGGYLQIPTAHFFGGDHTNVGHIDNPIRHAVSKLSSVHFASIEQHKQRLLRIGESEDRIYVIGSISLDKFHKHNSISKEEIRKIFKIKNGFERFALLIFHPVDEDVENGHNIFNNILESLKKHNINAFVSYPNTDPGNKKIINIIKKYNEDNNFLFYKNLERDLFLSVYKNSLFQIGNSSSGIVESASIPIPSIMVGPRQLGRLANKNAIFCDSDKNSINDSLAKVMSTEFSKKICKIKNLYGDGKSAEKAYRIIKMIDFKKKLFKTDDVLNYNYI